MYIKLNNGVPQPYSIAQLKRDNPNTSFPAVLTDASLEQRGIYRVTILPTPGYDKLIQYLKESDVYEVDGRWQRHYIVATLPEAQAADNVKAERNRLLAESDWVVAKAAEVQSPVPPEWGAYRQQLRDVTAQQGFPFNVVWPTKPR